uniref:CAP59 (Required for capsule formation) n=2 Tax=Kalmanozyma brasiliensis (strain GHG001) TaxID=1365824 RepID=V5EJG4_KALBG
MFSTLHIFLAVVWIGLPVATTSTLAAVASRYLSKSNASRDNLKAALLTALLCTVAWRTFTVNHHHSLPDLDSYPRNSNNETVFIAVNLYNSEHLFPAFSDNLLQVVHHLGEENVFISIYESNSHDRTKQLLSQFERELHLRGIQNSIRMLDNNRRNDMDRIERLALIRNEALNPIQSGVHGLHGRTFSKLLWLNDIFFRPESVLELFSTNGGRFDQVCGLDYLPLGFYDTWVMRDVEGNRQTPLWPYFHLESDIARLRKGELIPVNACWNGMTIFDAKWFLPTSNSTAQPGVDDGPIRFRTHPECLASECLLPSYDIHVRSKQRPQIFVNPRVVATYQWRDYLMYDWIMRSNIVNIWSRIWQDLISHSLFGFFVEIGRKKDDCAEALRRGWKPL